MQNFKNWHVYALLHAILVCAHGIENTCNTKEMHVMRDARHKLASGLLHRTCVITTGTVAAGNEIQLCCS